MAVDRDRVHIETAAEKADFDGREACPDGKHGRPPRLPGRFRDFAGRVRAIGFGAWLAILSSSFSATAFAQVDLEGRGTNAGKSEARPAEVRRGEDDRSTRADRITATDERAVELLGSLFEGLGPLGAGEESRRLATTLSERLDRTTARIEIEGSEKPVSLAKMQRTLAISQLNLGFPEKAIDLLTKSRTSLASNVGPDHPDTLAVESELAGLNLQVSRPDRAILLLDEARALLEAKRGRYHPDTLACMNRLAWAYHVAGRLDRAIPLSAEVVDTCRRIEPSSPMCGDAMATLGLSLVRARRWSDAEPILRDCLAIRRARMPDEWKTYLAMSALGEALMGQGRMPEAGPLLLAGYEGMKDRSDKIRGFAKTYVDEAVDRLIKLAEATGKADEARSWREEKGKLSVHVPPPMPTAIKP